MNKDPDCYRFHIKMITDVLIPQLNEWLEPQGAILLDAHLSKMRKEWEDAIDEMVEAVCKDSKEK